MIAKKKTVKRRDPSDPARRETEKRARRADRRKLKRTAIRIGVYCGKNTESAKKVHRAELFGVMAVGLDDVDRRVTKCLIATVTSSNGVMKAQALRPGSLSLYEWSENWDLNNPFHEVMLKHASDSLRKNAQVRQAAADLMSTLIKEDRQATLKFEGIGGFDKTPEANVAQKEMPDPFGTPATKALPGIHSLWVNGEHYEGTIETLRGLFKK